MSRRRARRQGSGGGQLRRRSWLLGLVGLVAACTQPSSGGTGGVLQVCPTGYAACGTECVDLLADTLNCGVCGNRCQVGQRCQAGVCQCQSDLTECPTGCADLNGDAENCGSCGNVCPAGHVCSLGRCTTEGCADGLVLCGANCVDTSLSPYHCGGCDNECPAGQSCVDGACGCLAGQWLCDGQCVDTSTSLQHCGTCGNSCPAGSTCSGGTCVEGAGGTGAEATGGATAAGGTAAGGTGAEATGAAMAAGGTAAGGIGGNATGGAPAAGGTAAGGIGGNATGAATAAGGSTTTGCGTTITLNLRPFGCDFAWGAPNEGNRSSYLDFVSSWVGYESRGGLDGACDGCNLARNLASTDVLAVYYAYFIGYQANLMGGFGDCNTDFDGHNLCTDGAQWIRDNYDLVIDMYAEYARRTYEASPNQPVIWWLEGDFIQYTYDEQNNPLSMQELGQLARDITCAVKTNEPNAVVAMNHSPWNPDEVTESFWGAMPLDVLDMVWTSGAGDNDGYTRPDYNADSYNAATNNYAYLHSRTGKTIMVDTSYASSGQPDRWSTATASALNDRIAEGVVGVLVSSPASNYQSAIQNLSSQLGSVCQ